MVGSTVARDLTIDYCWIYDGGRGVKAYRVTTPLPEGRLKDAIDALKEGQKNANNSFEEWRLAKDKRDLERDAEFEREELEFAVAQYLGPAYKHLISPSNEVYTAWLERYVGAASAFTDVQKAHAMQKLKELLQCQLEPGKC